MNEWFANADVLLAKVQDLYFRAEAHPGDPAIAKEIQDFTMSVCLAWKPQFDRLFAITEHQQHTIHEQFAMIRTLTARVESLTTCLQRYQAVQMSNDDSLTLVRPPNRGEQHG